MVVGVTVGVLAALLLDDVVDEPFEAELVVAGTLVDVVDVAAPDEVLLVACCTP